MYGQLAKFTAASKLLCDRCLGILLHVAGVDILVVWLVDGWGMWEGSEGPWEGSEGPCRRGGGGGRGGNWSSSERLIHSLPRQITH